MGKRVCFGIEKLKKTIRELPRANVYAIAVDFFVAVVIYVALKLGMSQFCYRR